DGQPAGAGLVADGAGDRFVDVGEEGDAVDGGELVLRPERPPAPLVLALGDVVDDEDRGVPHAVDDLDLPLEPVGYVAGLLRFEAGGRHRCGARVDDDEAGPDGLDEPEQLLISLEVELVERPVGADKVELVADLLVGQVEGPEPVDDAARRVLVVDVDDEPAGPYLLRAGDHGQPALAALGFAGQPVDLVAVQQAGAVAAAQQGRFLAGVVAVEDRPEVGCGPSAAGGGVVGGDRLP